MKFIISYTKIYLFTTFKIHSKIYYGCMFQIFCFNCMYGKYSSYTIDFLTLFSIKEYTEKEITEAAAISSLYLKFEAESEMFVTDEIMQTRLGETVKNVLKHANGKGHVDSITATLLPFELGT